MPGHCMQHTKWKATNNRAWSCHGHQVASTLLQKENAQFPHTVFYDFSIAFWIPAAAPLYLRVSPVYFGVLTSPQSPDNGSAATAEVERKHGKSWLTLKYLWFFIVLWLYEFWQWSHITVTLPQTKGLMCCDLERWDKVHIFSPYINSPSFAFSISPLCV